MDALISTSMTEFDSAFNDAQNQVMHLVDDYKSLSDVSW